MAKLSRIPLEYLLKDGIRIDVGPLGSESKSVNGTNYGEALGGSARCR